MTDSPITKFSRRKAEPQFFVYIAGIRSRGEVIEACKIGVAGNVARRLSDMHASFPGEFFAPFQSRMQNKVLALRARALLHAHFADNRQAGEWFFVEPEAAAEAACRLLGVSADDVKRAVKRAERFPMMG